MEDDEVATKKPKENKKTDKADDAEFMALFQAMTPDEKAALLRSAAKK